MEKITKESHKWAFDKATPQQRISSLELYASVYVVKLRLQQDAASRPPGMPLGTEKHADSFLRLERINSRHPAHQHNSSASSASTQLSAFNRTFGLLASKGPYKFRSRSAALAVPTVQE
jgi:hypothetical protein